MASSSHNNIIDLTHDSVISTLEEQLLQVGGLKQAAPVATEPSASGGEEETLGAEDVIELQSFLERKTWIEEKIKLLEAMPPIEVFVGVEHILPTNPGSPVPGLPTREQLAKWLAEHDKIEMETDQFDKGDMIRLKKFAKAKSRQNLSPEDTDLIELTLNTLFALDKLMHLLRVRGESHEHFGLRLSWEELRVGAWKDRESILSDMHKFIKTRACWSPSVYENLAATVAALDIPPQSNESSPVAPSSSSARFRVDSNASASSINIKHALLPPNSLGLSRSARYKLSESLSREAASFTTRILSFRNKWIMPSAAILDKLIETSRKPVPDQLLDEQDRLEDKTNGMDGISKFPMQLIMQWKKADELYAELKKDQASGRALREEIEDAKESHPSSRLGEGFMSRSNALTTRLSLISDPATSRSFPRPTHPSYPDQQKANESITTTLSTELRTAIKSARLALQHAQQYQKNCEAMERVATAKQEMTALISRFEVVTSRLTNGTESQDGDGTPPNLDSLECLAPLRHGAFLALLPSVISELESCCTSSDTSLSTCRVALLELQRVSLDPTFRSETETTMTKLETTRDQATRIRKEVERQAALIRDSRKVWEAIKDALGEVAQTRDQVLHLTDRQKWKPERGRDGAPLTPDSPSPDMQTNDLSPVGATQWLETLTLTLSKTVSIPSTTLLPLLGDRLANHIRSENDKLTGRISQFKELLRFWEDVRRQAAVMRAVRDETHDLEQRTEDMRSLLQTSRVQVLEIAEGRAVSDSLETNYREDLGKLKESVDAFVGGLSARVPFVTSTRGDTRMNAPSSLTRPSALEMLPFSPSSLDHAVRTDVNAFSLSLSGGVESLSRHLEHLRLAIAAKGVDSEVKSVLSDVQRIEMHLESLSASANQAITVKDLSVVEAILAEIHDGMDLLATEHRTLGSGTLLTLKKSMANLEALPSMHDPVVFETIVLPRKRSTELAVNRAETLGPQLDSMSKKIFRRLEGAKLAQKTEDLTRSLWKEIDEMSRLTSEQEKLVDAVPMHSSDSSSRLEQMQSQLEQLVGVRQVRITTATTALKHARISLDNSLSSHDDALHSIIHPRVVSAVDAEAKSKSFEPRIATLKEKISQRLRLISAATQLQSQASTLADEFLATRQKAEELTTALDDISLADSEDCEGSLQSVQGEVATLQRRFSQSAVQSIANLRLDLVELHKLPGAKDTAARDLLASRAAVVEEKTGELSDLESRISTLRHAANDKLDLVTRRAELEVKLGEASTALEGVVAELKQHEQAVEQVLQTVHLYSETLESPIAQQLVALRQTLGDLTAGKGSSGSGLMHTVRQSLNALKSVTLATDASVTETIIEPRIRRVSDLESHWRAFSTDLSAISSRIIEAERTEAERIANEKVRRDAAEREKARFAAEEKARLEAEERAALEAEKMRIAAEAASLREAQDQARRAAEERSRFEAEEAERRAIQEKTRRDEEQRRKALWEAEEAERRAALEKAQEAEVAERARRDAEDQARREREERERLRLHEEEDRRRAEAKKHELDVFGLMVATPSNHRRTMSREMVDLQSKILALRAKLRAIGLNGIVRPTGKASAPGNSTLSLPTEEAAKALRLRYNEVVAELASFPPHAQEPAPNAELRSLQFEVEASKPLAERLALLGSFSSAVTASDAALSDLLEHLDTFPELPEDAISSYVSDPTQSPEEQLSSRVGFTGGEIDAMKKAAEDVVDDHRVASEKDRLEQTWSELWDMSMERMNPVRASRPPSALNPSDAGRSRLTSTNTRATPPQTTSKKSRAFSSLSIGLGTPPNPPNKSRQSALSGMFSGSQSRSASRISNRSVSGPSKSTPPGMTTSNSMSSLWQKTTFSSRQRTNSSVSASPSPVATPRKEALAAGSVRSRANTNQYNLASPSPSEVTHKTFASSQPPRPASTMSRTNRTSLVGGASLPRSFKTSIDRSAAGRPSLSSISSAKTAAPRVRKTYVANKNHKVDIAVAKVVNTLDVDVNIEPVSWKDQSGKYWIGDTDPKLCFCRILRSHTVMVRVGGGWMELSKFIKTHYADAYRLIPPTALGSPPKEKEEKWISSATLLEAPQAGPSTSSSTAARPPSTPEPHHRSGIDRSLRASLSPLPEPFKTPSTSGLVAPTNASPGSPLTPLQFIRRADELSLPLPPSHVGRPSTPLASKGATPRSSTAMGRATPGTDPKRAPSVLKWRF